MTVVGVVLSTNLQPVGRYRLSRAGASYQQRWMISLIKSQTMECALAVRRTVGSRGTAVVERLIFIHLQIRRETQSALLQEHKWIYFVVL